jgi:prophage regulatory protein
MQLLSRNDVLNKTSLSRTTLFRLERSGEFPQAVQLTPNRVAYDSDEVEAWIQRALSRKSYNFQSAAA